MSALLLGPLVLVGAAPVQTAPDAGTAQAPSHVGSAVCAGCHAEEHALWSGSHHDLAMQAANDETVLGDFSGVEFAYAGVSSRFFRRDGLFMVRTDGADGTIRDYQVAYTFGVSPLQQYLIAFPDGRLQALTIAWDSRPEEEGGQRWFHLYPDDDIRAGDALHWTAASQNWNYMCAECHSTDLRRGYRLNEDRYQTSWAEIDVACEACHGPGEHHVAWAEGESRGSPSGDSSGLVHELADDGGREWHMDLHTGIARRSGPEARTGEVETCARCHSRRGSIREGYQHGRPLMDSHRPALLQEDLYFPDGQIKGEVYVYGSFLQSKMYRAGVSCSDCHDPHSLKTRAEGNALCAQCHLPERFDTRAHHHHEPGSRGSRCVECHMPSRNYMVVDARRDHSFRVPSPALAALTDSPDPCTACHQDRSLEWAARTVSRWRNGPPGRHFGEAIHAGRTRSPGAAEMLARLADDAGEPGIARATALTLMAEQPTEAGLRSAAKSLGDDDPLVRAAAVGFLENLEPRARLRLGAPLLTDSVRGVRVEAARVMADLPGAVLDAQQRRDLDAALEEYREGERANAERPESHLNLGLLAVRQGRYGEAERAYRLALRLSPAFTPAVVNLADLYRLTGRDDEGESVLRGALEEERGDAGVHHSLGLLLVRQKRLDEAVAFLGRAAELAPESARYAYVHAVALERTQGIEAALQALRAAHSRHPRDRRLLYALATYSRDAGEVAAARRYARELLALSPGDSGARALVRELSSGGG